MKDYFQKQDANHDGILTLEEFVAFRSKMPPEQATILQQTRIPGGMTTKDGVTGMTLVSNSGRLARR